MWPLNYSMVVLLLLSFSNCMHNNISLYDKKLYNVGKLTKRFLRVHQWYAASIMVLQTRWDNNSNSCVNQWHAARAGITYVSVHDCYWTHPCDVDIMNKVFILNVEIRVLPAFYLWTQRDYLVSSHGLKDHKAACHWLTHELLLLSHLVWRTMINLLILVDCVRLQTGLYKSVRKKKRIFFYRHYIVFCHIDLYYCAYSWKMTTITIVISPGLKDHDAGCIPLVDS
jgi:hypothetical protein